MIRDFRMCACAAAIAFGLLPHAGWAADAVPVDVAPVDGAPAGGVMAFVVTSVRFALHESDGGRDECPHGLNASQHQNYLAQFPTDAARAAYEARYGFGYGNRGPNGENIFYNPTVAEDPLPYWEAGGKDAPGLNLDGKVDADDFVGTDGAPGVDNQLYRAIGCVPGFRSNGHMWGAMPRRTRQLVQNRYIVEVSGIDDLKNDPSVIVRTTRGLDPVSVSAADEPIPGGTQRIDTRYSRRYTVETRGRIVDGWLITDPVDASVPMLYSRAMTADFKIRGMVLQLKLTPAGAKGYIAGFADVDSWWNWMARTWGDGAVADTGSWTPAPAYAAIHRLADGYPDPATGKNTAISMALAVEFVQTFVTGEQDSQRLALAGPGAGK